jgi:hypothetical protein
MHVHLVHAKMEQPAWMKDGTTNVSALLGMTERTAKTTSTIAILMTEERNVHPLQNALT